MAAEGPLHELGAIADRQLRLAGDGPDHGDGPAHASARQRDDRRGVVARRHGHPGLPAEATTPRRHGARPPLPRQGDDRAGDHPWARRARRVAPAGPPRRHRPVEAGLVRGQAGARPQGRLPRRGRRWARATRPSSAPSRRATGRTGAARPAAASLRLDVRLARGAGGRRARRRRRSPGATIRRRSAGLVA